MKKKIEKKLVTKVLFKETIKKLGARLSRIDKRLDSLDAKFERLALVQTKTDQRINGLEETMLTKNDIHTLLNRMDGISLDIRNLERGKTVPDHH